jgi:hypothetical protein
MSSWERSDEGSLEGETRRDAEGRCRDGRLAPSGSFAALRMKWQACRLPFQFPQPFVSPQSIVNSDASCVFWPSMIVM